MNKLLKICLLFSLSGSLLAQSPPELQPEEQERLYRLSQQYRCLVCQNESIADSRAGLADDLRREIAIQIKEQKSNEEIHEYLVSRYGDFVSYDPPFNWKTVILWLFPIVVMFALAFTVWRKARFAPSNTNEKS